MSSTKLNQSLIDLHQPLRLPPLLERASTVNGNSLHFDKHCNTSFMVKCAFSKWRRTGKKIMTSHSQMFWEEILMAL